MKNETGTAPKFKTKTSAKSEPGLNELFLDRIMDLYWAENHLVKSLPKMIKAADALLTDVAENEVNYIAAEEA